MKRESYSLSADRYVFDFGICKAISGWCQVDTRNDAHYFGNWVNPFKLKTMSYVEGDVYEITCDTEAEFKAELEKFVSDEDFVGVDPINDRNKERMIAMGWEKYLH